MKNPNANAARSDGGLVPATDDPASRQDAALDPAYPSLDLKGDQVAAAGLDNAAVGDTYDVTVRCEITKVDTGITPSLSAQIVSVDNAMPCDDSEPDNDEPPQPTTQGRALSAKDAGFLD